MRLYICIHPLQTLVGRQPLDYHEAICVVAESQDAAIRLILQRAEEQPSDKILNRIARVLSEETGRVEIHSYPLDKRLGLVVTASGEIYHLPSFPLVKEEM